MVPNLVERSDHFHCPHSITDPRSCQSVALGEGAQAKHAQIVRGHQRDGPWGSQLEIGLLRGRI